MMTMAGNNMTKSDDIARTVLRILCSQPSCQMDIKYLKQELRRYDIRQHFNIETFLDDYSNKFMVVDGSVSAFTTLEICPNHCQKKGRCDEDYCSKLHVCKFFLLSQCSYDRMGVCQFGHDLDSPHNRPLIKDNLLNGLTVQAIQRLFQSGQSRTSLTMPLVCKFYNHKRGCTRRVFCPHLHICQYYVEGSCKFGTGCNRNHNINDPQVLKVLNRFGINMHRRPKDILQDLRMSLSRERDTMIRFSSMPSLSMSGLSSQAKPFGRHKPVRVQRMSEGPGSTPIGGRDEICKYHLRGGKGCWFGKNCSSLHMESAYQWQHLDESRNEWVDFEDFINKTIETSFRNVDCSECTVCFDDSDEDDYDDDDDDDDDSGKEQGEIIVDFHTMKAHGKGKQLEIRRLGTASTVSVHPQIARSFREQLTHWLWYWFDDVIEQWIEYGQKGPKGKTSSVDSSDVEKAYLSGERQLQFQVGLASFKLKFSTMEQKNLQTGKKKVVRRRPEPIY